MNNENHLKRSKKPKPLFGLFGKKTNHQIITTNLGSGTTFLPLSSSILENNNQTFDPYSPPPIQKPLFSPQYQQPTKGRQRSKSVGREAYPNNNNINNKLLEDRELAFNKLCKKEISPNNGVSSSLVDSLPLLSPTSFKSGNSTSPISPNQPSRPKMLKKSSSAHDLRKANKLQQESINQIIHKAPLPNKNDALSRSKSFNNPQKLKSSKSQQQLSSAFHNHGKIPALPPLPTNDISHHLVKSIDDDDDDDDIPLGYLQSPTHNRPSSLLSDKEDDDDIDLIPIASINSNQESIKNISNIQSAADKYKERVKERLNINTSDDDDDDDDDIPISLTLLSPRDRLKFKV